VQRDLPFAADAAVIDYVPVRREASATTVMAAAVEQKRLDAVRLAVEAAGCRLDRVSLRCMGCAALVARLDTLEAGVSSGSGAATGGSGGSGIFVIDIAGDTVEFSVVVDGTLRFSRAADLADADDPVTVAEAVITETRRTWLSYRAAEDTERVAQAIVLGDRGTAQRVAAAIGEIVQLPTETLTRHPRLRGGEADVSGYGSLAGLLLEPLADAERLDLLRPRKPADRAAQLRQLVLVGLAIVIVASGIAWTVGRRQFDAAQRNVDDLEQKANASTAEYYRFIRDSDRLRHLQEWEKINVDWLAHALHLQQAIPPPNEVVLDGWVGTLNTLGVEWEKNGDRWSAPMDIRIVIDGEASVRAAADRVRAALVEDESYQTTSREAESTSGKRLPHSFSYQIRTAQAVPPAQAPAPVDGTASLDAAGSAAP
jgi:hypothetical protein